MKISKVVVAAAVLALSGCLSPKTSGVVVQNGRLYVEDPAFATNIEIVQDAKEVTPEGFLHVQVMLKNTNRRDFPCQFRFQWVTLDGLLQNHAETPWRPAIIHGRDTIILNAVSPLQGSNDFRLVLRRAQD